MRILHAARFKIHWPIGSYGKFMLYLKDYGIGDVRICIPPLQGTPAINSSHLLYLYFYYATNTHAAMQGLLTLHVCIGP